jgi:hypothetical protein
MLSGGATKTFTASEQNYHGPINASSTNAQQATVSPNQGTGPSAIFTVTPLDAGNPAIDVSDDHNNHKQVFLTITGPLTTNPTSLSFNGTTQPQQFNASDPNYGGTLHASSDNQNVATVNPNGTGPNATFTVTPVAQGNANITVTDDNGGSAVVTVSVSTGGLIINPTSLTIRVNDQKTFTATENNFSGLFFANSTNILQATVSPSQAPGPGPATFTVTGVSAGNPSIGVTDGHSPPQFVSVAVTGPLTTNPTSLTFDGSSTSPQTFNASDPNNSSTINTSNSNPNVASVSPPSAPGSNVIFTVTPLVQGNTTITLTDGQGATATEDVTVQDGPLMVSTNSLTFNSATAPSQNFTASENFYNRLISTGGCGGIVSVNPPNGPGPSQQFTVSPLAAGSCTLAVTDDHGGSRQISITVLGQLMVNPSSLTFTDVGPANSKTFVASESGYSGLVTESDNCSGVATVSPASGNAPVTFTVTAVASATGGSCTITVADDHGGSAPVSVTVGPFGPVVPNPNTFSFVGAGQTGNFTVSETNYTGSFTATDNGTNPCSTAGIATISPASGTSFTITSQGPGNCAFNLNAYHGQTAEVTVFVTTGTLTVNPTTIQIANITTGPTPAPFTASDPNNPGNYIASSNNSTVATVNCLAPCSGTSAQVIVTPVGNGQATITVTDGVPGSQANVSIGVGTSPLIKPHKLPKTTLNPRPEPARPPIGTPTSGANGLKLNQSSILLMGVGATGSISATDTGFSGQLTAMTSTANVATASVIRTGPSTWAIVVTSRGVGVASIVVSDGHAAPQTIVVRVLETPRVKSAATPP